MSLSISIEGDNNNNDDEEEAEKKWLQKTLTQNYKNLEFYCNAQTRLQNSLILQHNNNNKDSNSERTELLLELSDAIQDVQQDLETLRNSISISRSRHRPRKQELLQRHVELYERVIKTIYEHGGMYHPNGIPATKDNIEIKTVSLASLRASISHLEESFGISS